MHAEAPITLQVDHLTEVHQAEIVCRHADDEPLPKCLRGAQLLSLGTAD